MTINCTTNVPSAITLRFNNVPVSVPANPRVSITAQTATFTTFVYSNIGKGDDGLSISCTVISGGTVVLGTTTLVVHCEFVIVLIF